LYAAGSELDATGSGSYVTGERVVRDAERRCTRRVRMKFRDCGEW
jgi:hypothetical protein